MRMALKDERGFTFVEVIIAVALLGIIAGGFLAALAASSNNTRLSDERTTAESLARTEMELACEYVSNYSCYVYGLRPNFEYELPDNPPTGELSHTLPPGYETYTVHVVSAPLRDGVQTITVTVSRDGRVIYSIQDYKVFQIIYSG